MKTKILLIGIVGLIYGQALFAQTVSEKTIGQIEYSRGVGLVQQAGQSPRFVGAGQPLYPGDVLTTSNKGIASVKFEDGTRMTLRPDTQLILQNYQFDAQTKQGHFLFEMLKGGLRTLTGYLSKQEGNSANIKTPVATIGIRGTDFDARLCDLDCGQENRVIARPESKNRVTASARVVQLKGLLTAIGLTGERRYVSVGGPAYAGDVLETGLGATAVLAFRDESRISIGERSRLRIEDFVFDAAQPREGRFFVNLMRGAARTLTGLIGKANQRNVEFRTTTATIGIRGTGFDVTCYGTCAQEPKLPLGDGMTVYTWQGQVIVVPAAQAKEGMEKAKGVLLPAGRGGNFPGSFSDAQLPADTVGVAPTGNAKNTLVAIGQSGEGSLSALYQPVGEINLAEIARPDSLPINFQQVFGVTELSDSEKGLYVAVRDGHVSLEVGNERLDLGRGETGYVRPSLMPDASNSLPVLVDPANAVINNTSVAKAGNGTQSNTVEANTNNRVATGAGGQTAVVGVNSSVSDKATVNNEGVKPSLYNVATTLNGGVSGGDSPSQTLRPVSVPNFIEFDAMPLPSDNAPSSGSNTFDLIPLLERNGVKPALICK